MSNRHPLLGTASGTASVPLAHTSPLKILKKVKAKTIKFELKYLLLSKCLIGTCCYVAIFSNKAVQVQVSKCFSCQVEEVCTLRNRLESIFPYISGNKYYLLF